MMYPIVFRLNHPYRVILQGDSTGEILRDGANTEDEARADIVARGFWLEFQMAFFDIKIFNPFAKTYLNMNLESAFRTNEKSKKREYNERVVRVEHGSFTPVVLSSCGGFGVETSRFISKLIKKTSEKKDLTQSVVSNYIRTKISFQLVRSQVACIRGSRRSQKMKIDTGEMELVINSSSIKE